MSIISVDDRTFHEEIDVMTKPVLLYFKASWCAPCKIQQNIIEKLNDFYKHTIIIASIDVDTSHELAKEYEVVTIPTLKLLLNKKVVQTFIGTTDIDALQAAIAETL